MKQNLQYGWKRWKALAKKIGAFQARIIFSVLYYIIFTPVSFFVRSFNGKQKLLWQDYTQQPNTLEEMKQQ